MRVFLVDDQVWLRSALRLLLEQETNAIVVGEAGTINALPSCIQRLHPDILFLDWQLPGLETMSARQRLVDRIRAIEPNLYIIALFNDDRVLGSPRVGADAYVDKAQPPEQILTVMQKAANRKLVSSNRTCDFAANMSSQMH